MKDKIVIVSPFNLYQLCYKWKSPRKFPIGKWWVSYSWICNNSLLCLIASPVGKDFLPEFNPILINAKTRNKLVLTFQNPLLKFLVVGFEHGCGCGWCVSYSFGFSIQRWLLVFLGHWDGDACARWQHESLSKFNSRFQTYV